jgi:hypothetical protein
MHQQKNIDSISRVEPVRTVYQKPKTNLRPTEFITSSPRYSTIEEFQPKQIRKSYKQRSIVFASILATALISIAGQGYAQRSNAESENLSTNYNNSEITMVETDNTQSLIVIDEPLGPKISQEESELTTRAKFLEEYLTKRKSPAAPYAESIAAQPQWKLIVGIMRAESQWCKKHVTSTKNCFGVGGAWNLRVYDSYPEAFADMNRLLETKYIKYGLDTPEKIVGKYVGHQSPNWVSAVKEELNNLNHIN